MFHHAVIDRCLDSHLLLQNESELHLVLRVEDDDPVDLEAEKVTDAMRTMMRGKKLGDFTGAK